MMEQVQKITARNETVREIDLEEETCVERAMSGDKKAIDWLITRYRVRAVRIALVMLRHSGEAEDAAQEAFIRAFRNLSSYRRDGRFYAWFYRIVVRTCLDRIRRSNWNTEVTLDPSLNWPQAENCFEGVEFRMVVDRLLEKLNPQQRAIIVLRELEDLDYSEIADVLSIPVGRVKWRLHAARKNFQELWIQYRRETDNVS